MVGISEPSVLPHTADLLSSWVRVTQHWVAGVMVQRTYWALEWGLLNTGWLGWWYSGLTELLSEGYSTLGGWGDGTADLLSSWVRVTQHWVAGVMVQRTYWALEWGLLNTGWLGWWYSGLTELLSEGYSTLGGWGDGTADLLSSWVRVTQHWVAGVMVQRTYWALEWGLLNTGWLGWWYSGLTELLSEGYSTLGGWGDGTADLLSSWVRVTQHWVAGVMVQRTYWALEWGLLNTGWLGWWYSGLTELLSEGYSTLGGWGDGTADLLSSWVRVTQHWVAGVMDIVKIRWLEQIL